MAAIVTVLDANVLFPGALCDTLLRTAERSLIDVRWSAKILEETRRNLIAKGEMTEAQAQTLLTAMQTAFPKATVTETYRAPIPLFQKSSILSLSIRQRL